MYITAPEPISTAGGEMSMPGSEEGTSGGGVCVYFVGRGDCVTEIRIYFKNKKHRFYMKLNFFLMGRWLQCARRMADMQCDSKILSVFP
jgi:hypothetical protein